jgi:hypothetical protein
MSTPKLIVLTRIESSREDLTLFGYDEVGNDDYEIWDISRATSQISHKWEFKKEANKSSRIKRLSSIEEIKNKIKEGGEKNFYALSRLWKDKKMISEIRNLICENGNLVEKYNKLYPFKNRNGYLKSLAKSNKNYFRRLMGNVTKRRNVGESEYIFVPTEWYKGKAVRQGLKTKVKKIHSAEYDRYLAAEGPEGKSKKGIVFLDQAVPYHVDMKNRHEEDWINEKEYYEEVRDFLSRCEREIGTERQSTCVAAHPNTEKRKIERHFPERAVYKGRTPEVVKGSNLVVTHYSSAALFAVMDGVELCFFSVRPFHGTKEQKNVEDIASLYGRKVNSENQEDKIDYGSKKKKYKKMMRKFVKTPNTPDVNSWVYVYNTLIG